ncbi:DUF7529 family protein [Haloarchaeobius sp. TZWWS8]|uniref:DUF7529 family protein n=1 Tax=Haloarchaeobius sp. TZWWS8 TaxID=3446121 RepID=UPI003EBCDB7D
MEGLDDDAVDEAKQAMGVADRVMPAWEQVVSDMEATAEEYRDSGWTAIECHPGDVAMLTEGDRTGLDVLLPDDEFDELQASYEADDSFDEVEVFRATQAGILFAVAALKNETTETTLLVPLYYDTDRAQEFIEMVHDEGELRLHLRPLDERQVVTFTQHDPAPFLPGES